MFEPLQEVLAPMTLLNNDGSGESRAQAAHMHKAGADPGFLIALLILSHCS